MRGDAGYDTCIVRKTHLGGNRQFVGFDDRPSGDLPGETTRQWKPLDSEGGRRTRDRTRDAGGTEVPESHLQEYTTGREALAWVRERERKRGGKLAEMDALDAEAMSPSGN